MNKIISIKSKFYQTFGTQFIFPLKQLFKVLTRPINMRLSFVQRLKNEKHQTVPTRESQQKSTSNSTHSIKLKSHSLKHEKSNLTQHCNDIKNLLSILQSTKNPQFQPNTSKVYGKTKTQQKKQFHHELIFVREERKQNSLKLIRPISVSSIKEQKQLNQKSKRIDEKNFVDFEVKFQQGSEQNLLYGNHRANMNANKLLPYRFPGKKKLDSNTVLPPIVTVNKISESRKGENKTKQVQEVKINEKCPKVLNSCKQSKRGLQNIGNTCYINSIVQCLFHLPSFSQYFSNGSYLKEHKEKQKFNSDRSIVEKYRDLYQYVMKAWKQPEEKKSTYSLKLALSKSCCLFLDWQQEDAHEFMRKLLDAMHQEINRSLSNVPYKILKTRTNLQYSSVSSLANEYFQYYKQKDDSFIYDCFGGQLYNSIECVNCHSQSISFENCLDLSLPLVKGKLELGDLLGDFFGKEKLCDFYTCQYCGQTNKNSVKTTKFWRAPQILIIQLKRSKFGKKDMDPITFPIDILSLQNYINDQNDKISQKYANYTLKSVVNHRGASSGGHYWSVIKEFGQWYEIDDEKVSKLSASQVKNQFEVLGSSEAYILFYESMSR